MEKLYDRIDFQNDTTPALNETNLNAMSKAIDDIDNRLIKVANASGSGGGGGSSVEWNQLKKDGEKIAEITIDGKKQDVFASEGGSGSVTEYGTTAEFEAEKDGFPVGTEYLVTDDYVESSNDYSLDEVLIGKFLGKNLYRKVYRTSENGIAIQTSKTSVDAYVDNKADIETIITATILRPTGYGGYGNFTSQGGAYIEDGVIKLYSGTTSATNITHFILEYTKVGD